MKLAEALQERADINRKINELTTRIKQNCLVQEGESPNEAPALLIDELNSCIDRLQYLISSINKTNNTVQVNGRTLTDIIAEKDAANIRLNSYRQFVNEAGNRTQRSRFSEIKIMCAVNVIELQRTADGYAKRVRELDNLLQQANWTTELIEN
ncbi:MAG: DIP1984 family protein [Firmicutes bacterium]|nr:DIP1984 family protein [Bacillota bacterium]